MAHFLKPCESSQAQTHRFGSIGARLSSSLASASRSGCIAHTEGNTAGFGKTTDGQIKAVSLEVALSLR
jgi:hypothetical protein